MEAATAPPAVAAAKDITRLWWLWLVFGALWSVIAVVILQFDQASVTTVGVLIGLMFFLAGVQNFAGAALAERHGWVYGLFGVLFVIAGVVASTIGRPVLFRQRRIGVDGEPFEVLKFRTMRPDRRGQRLDVIHDRRRTHKSDNDPRHTRIGRVLRRHSLDELPQLLNVLRGEMSVVGPRPELDGVVEQYPPALHQRHYVKPGLTGLWQVSARGSGPMHENGQWDLAYVDRVSLRTDLQILAMTPRALLGDTAGS